MDYSLGVSLRMWKIISDSLLLLLLLPFLHAVFIKKDKREGTLRIICGYILTAIIVLALKYSLKVPRPLGAYIYLKDYSFPSMHSSLAFLSASYISPLLYIWSLLIAYSRLALGVHRLIDVIAGIIIGISIPWVVTRYWQTLKKNINKKTTKKECLRQIFHLFAGLFIFFLASLFPKPVAFLTITFFLSFLMFFQSMDKIRHIYSNIFPNYIIKRVYNYVKRRKEERILIGPISLLFGSLITIAFFPPSAYLPSLLVVAISDALATLVGVSIGSHALPFNKNKTIEGTIAGGTTTFIIFEFYSSYVVWYKPLLMALLFIVLEMIPINKRYEMIDDNLLFPFIFSLAWWLLFE